METVKRSRAIAATRPLGSRGCLVAVAGPIGGAVSHRRLQELEQFAVRRQHQCRVTFGQKGPICLKAALERIKFRVLL